MIKFINIAVYIKKYIIYLVFLTLCLPGISSGATLYSPDLEWKSIKTQHFWIHYHQGLEELAVKLSTIAETVHERLTKLNKWAPELRTDVILVDNMDLSNGSATPFPFNRIEIYISRPELDSGLNNFNDWLTLVFTHEYTHILNMDQVNRFPYGLRKFLGRLYFPNIFLPMWMIEGHAVYHESLLPKSGRNHCTYTDMIFRTECNAQGLKNLTEASHFPRAWPSGTVPYLYGGQFIEYLEKKYPNATFADVFEANSDNAFPYLINKNARDVYGTNFPILWEEWQKYLSVKFQNQIDKIKTDTLTEIKEITGSGYNTILPRFSRDSKSVYYARLTAFNKPALMKYSLENGKSRLLCKIHSPNSMSVSNSGKIFLSDIELFKSFSVYNDIFVFSNCYKQKTRGLRAGYVDITPDEEKAVFIKNEKNRYSMILSNILFTDLEEVIKGSDIQLAFPKISPDKKNIIFTMKDRDGKANLVLLNIQKNEYKRLTDGEYNDICPTWHPEGNRIIFSSDRTGVYNLYEFDLTSVTLSRLTNLLGGAFSANISPDGKNISFASYGQTGFNIALMPYPEKKLESALAVITDLSPDFFISTQIKQDNTKDIKTGSYSVWNSIFPAYWIPLPIVLYPFVTAEEYYRGHSDIPFGFSTSGSDTLYQNIYFLEAAFYPIQTKADLHATYIFSKFYPNLILNYQDDALILGKDKFPWDNDPEYYIRRDRSRSGAIALSFPFIKYLYAQEILLLYKFEKEFSDISYPPYGKIEHYSSLLARARAAYIFSNSHQYSYSISKEDGRDFSIVGDVYSRAIGSEVSFYKSYIKYTEYIPGVFMNNVIMLHIRGGISINNPDYLSPYHLGRFAKGVFESPRTDYDELGMRGYPASNIYGNKIAAGSLEYRFPVFQSDKAGYWTIPVFLKDVWFAFFYEYGNVWNNKTNIKDFKSSAGAEIHLKITLGYAVDITGYIGFAHGFNKYGENQVYFGIETIYEGAFKNINKSIGYL